MDRLAAAETSTSLVDRIAQNVETMILSGELGPDEPVNINAVAKQTGVSLVPVREALARLSASGLLRFVPNRGYRVSPRLDGEKRLALFQARELLEIAAASSVVEKATQTLIDRLAVLNEEMKSLDGDVAEDRQAFFRLNDEFHRTYVGMSGNPFVLRMFESLSFDLLMARESSYAIDVARLCREHDDIIERVGRRDVSALQRTLVDHIRSTL